MTQQPSINQQLARGASLLRAGRVREASNLLESLRDLAPKSTRVLDLLAQAYAGQGREGDAVAQFRKALSIDPQNHTLRLNLAITLQRGARHDEALAEVERLLYRVPNDPRALRAKASILSDLRQHDKAAVIIRTLLAHPAQQTWHPEQRMTVAISAARLAPAHFDVKEAIEGLLPHLRQPDLPAPMRISAYNQLGRLYEQLGSYDDAFEAYKASKEAIAPEWDPDAHASWCDKLIHAWTDESQNVAPVEGVDGSKLVFIVGMMRSGTSLTEQMLSRHPGIFPAGERNVIARLIAQAEPPPAGGRQFLPLPITISRYTPKRVTELATQGIEAYSTLAGDAWGTRIITDKQPYNFYYVPLLAKLFPRCRIIHCTRDRLDTCFSCYAQAFSAVHPYTHDLEWLGRYHNDYRRVMEAWYTIRGCRIVDLPYERLVNDPEPELRRLLEELGLEWDDRVLSFHESDRYVRTSSRDQVHKPLYTSSVGRHERFRKRLQPLKDAIEAAR